MKVFAIVFGVLGVALAITAQVTGASEDMAGAVYHHIWWAFCGGICLAIGISID